MSRFIFLFSFFLKRFSLQFFVFCQLTEQVRSPLRSLEFGLWLTQNFSKIWNYMGKYRKVFFQILHDSEFELLDSLFLFLPRSLSISSPDACSDSWSSFSLSLLLSRSNDSNMRQCGIFKIYPVKNKSS